MEYTLRELSGNTEDATGRKMSRFKFLKVRLFGRLKKKETEGEMKQSQSTGDVTAPKGERSEDDSEDDCHYPEGTLSSRALSHDSIFLADPVQSSQPTRVLSQENVHTKIKALQLKLQQKNMRLAPSMLIPGTRIEDSGTTSEDDGLPRSPPEMSFQEVVMQRGASKYPDKAKSHLSLLSLTGTGSEEEEQGGLSQPTSRPLSPVPQLFQTEPPCAGVDFTRPATYIPTLDNSAARHRMSIKPKNQRAVTKVKKTPTAYRRRSSSMNNLDQMHSKTMYHYSFDIEDLPQAEELVSHLKVEPENMTQLSGSQWSPLNTNNKATKRFQHEDKTKDSFFVSFDEIPVLRASHHIREPMAKEPSLSPLCISSADISCDYTVINEGHDDDRQIEPLKTSIDFQTVVSKPAGIRTKPHPVPAPRTKKSKISLINNCPTKVFGLKPVEKDTASSLGLAESPKEDESLRPCQFPFNIAPAKYRSKTSDENVCKQDEESSGNTQKSQTYKHNPVVQMEKMEKSRSLEVCRNTPSAASEKKNNLWKDVLAQNVSKTGVVDQSEKYEHTISPQDTQYLQNEQAEESEDKRDLFGVKLRSTSLCLKYRSELPKLESEIKRHSLEAHLIPAVKEQDTFELEAIDNARKGYVQESLPPLSLDLQYDLDKEIEADKRSGPAWKSQARVPQSFAAKSPTQPAPPPNPTTSLTTPQSPSSHLSKPSLHSRPKIQTTSKPQPTTPSSQSVPPRTAPRAMDRWPMSHQRDEKCFVKQSTHKDDLADYKGQSKPAAKANSQTEPEQQASSDRAEPTWMELAKRKSLAWSDMALDSVHF